MHLSVLTFLAMIPLAVIALTGMFGLADLKPISHSMREGSSTFEILLGVSLLLMSLSAIFLALSLLGGKEPLTWPGLGLLCGAAGVFLMIGHYAPWRKWIKRERA